MENTLFLAALAHNPKDLAMFIAAAIGSWLMGLLVFAIFYGWCRLSAGFAMRLGYTFALFLFLVALFFVFVDLSRYFVWWQYTPGTTNAVMNDAILLLALSVVWLVVIWTVWPKPRKVPAV
jgi:hypothetical protein